MPSAQVPGFLPSQSGFHFVNSWPPGTNYPVVTLPLIGTVISQDAAHGLCGGFVLAALDLFLHTPQLLPPNDMNSPAGGTPLFNYISSRLVDSLVSNGPKDIQWIQTPDHDVQIEIFEGPGLARRMVQTEWPAIKAEIDSGKPSPLSLIGPPQCGDGDIPGIIDACGHSHQVLAWAYNLDTQNNLTLKVYDCNQPFNNDAEISMNIGDPAHTIAISAPSISAILGVQIRGLFRSTYALKDPSSIALPSVTFKVWGGKFNGQDSLLLYNPPSNNWWLGTFSNGALQWTNVGNTAGFGNVFGNQFWVGSFMIAESDNILFYNPPDSNWWIGSFSGSGSSLKLSWKLATNTAGFGNISSPPPAHRFWVGSFDGTGKDNILFFNQADENWWLGQFDNAGNLSFKLATNSKGFGGGEAIGVYFVGKFSNKTADSILFYFPGDGNWWLGNFNGTSLSFVKATNTSGFGDISAPPPVHRFWVGNFTGTGMDSIVFFNQPDENWWSGTFADNQLSWALATNSKGFGGGENAGTFFSGGFEPGSDSIFFYFPQDGDWLLGTFAAGNLSFNRAVNTAAAQPANTWQFGYIADDLFFLGAFSSVNTSILFFHEDGHWWQGKVNNGTMTWQLVAETLGKAW